VRFLPVYLGCPELNRHLVPERAGYGMTSALVLLITPTDRQQDAQRLTAAGFRVIVTSRAQSTVRQIIDADSAVIAIEFVPSFSDETLAFIDHVARSGRDPRTPLVIYGSNTTVATRRRMDAAGAIWVEVRQECPSDLVEGIRGALADQLV
jgi:hypothetical protein